MEGETVYSFKNGQKIKLIIWDNNSQYIENAPDAAPGVVAYFHPYDYTIIVEPGKPDQIVWQEEIGEIHFVAGRYGSGVVAHECGHACFHWAILQQMDPLNDHEADERFCFELGRMVACFWQWHYELLEKITGLS